jgi:hypothetical protein
MGCKCGFKGDTIKATALQMGEGFRKRKGVPGQPHSECITGQFPFRPNTAAYPPNARMVEHRDFNQRLQKVDNVIVAEHMRKFMGKQRLKMQRVQVKEPA